MKRSSYSREERQQMILDKFYNLVNLGKKPELTSYRLAKLLDMTPSSHLKGILWDMVNIGLLESYAQHHKSNAEKTVFYLPESQYSFPKQYEREIVINGEKERF